MTKGQVSIEFMMIFTLLIAALAIVAVISYQKTVEVLNARESVDANEVLTMVANKINNVFMEGDGFETKVSLPYTIFGSDYTITISPNMVYLNLGENTHSKSIITGNVQGNFTSGENLLRNNNGVVEINV